MCFNAEVSIGAYIIGLFGCYYLYTKGFIIEAIFYAWVAHMQLIEYFLWKNQPCNPVSEITENNIKISKAGIIVNHLEPFILWGAILYFSSKKLPNTLNYFMIVFAIITYNYVKSVYKERCTTVTEESKPHLYWEWNYNNKIKAIYYTIFLFVLMILSIYGLNNGGMHAIIIFLSFIISHIVYGKKRVIGSMWCFMAAFIPWVLPEIYKIKI